MKHSRWLAVLLALLPASEAHSQIFIGGSFGGGRKPRIAVAVGVPAPYLGGYVAPYASSFTRVDQVTVIYAPPPTIVLRVPPPDDIEVETGPRRPALLPPPEPKAAPPRKPDPLPPAKPELKPPPAPPLPLNDLRTETARLLDRGRDAFAAGEYGRARERFAQAAQVNPAEPLAPFLLAQALIALGKYHEAVDAIHAGLALKPDWPTTAYRPQDLYGLQVQDYADHVRRLEATRGDHPADPVLLFLNAYLMWFDGRKDEARPLFRRALQRNADRADVERFLLAA
jgi:tetratricopeptide (TPR) repeat protein